MTCRHCRDADEFFGSRTAKRDLRRFRKKGPSPLRACWWTPSHGRASRAGKFSTSVGESGPFNTDFSRPEPAA